MIYTFGKTIPVPTKFFIADSNQLCSTDTYYTAVNVTSGKGKLTRICVNFFNSNVDTSKLTLKITIDGTETTVNGNGYYSRSIALDGAASYTGREWVFLWIGDLNFYSSMKVEYKHSGHPYGSFSPSISIDYSLE